MARLAIMTEYCLEDGLACITLDDGKVNALGSTSIAEVNARLDRALQDDASAVVVSGRLGIFSAGFDLGELKSGDSAREDLRRRLVDLNLRIFTFERPVVLACTGHALAAGASLLLAADRRIGLEGAFQLGFNEAGIGVSISPATVELARYRMPMPWFESIVSGETFTPRDARRAGLLDKVVVDSTELAEEARKTAQQLAAVPLQTYVEMRRLARAPAAEVIRGERRRLSTVS